MNRIGEELNMLSSVPPSMSPTINSPRRTALATDTEYVVDMEIEYTEHGPSKNLALPMTEPTTQHVRKWTPSDRLIGDELPARKLKGFKRSSSRTPWNGTRLNYNDIRQIAPRRRQKCPDCRHLGSPHDCSAWKAYDLPTPLPYRARSFCSSRRSNDKTSATIFFPNSKSQHNKAFNQEI